MHQSLLSPLKPLIFAGKSGVLHVIHKYDDQAWIFLKEGIVEQVKTTTFQGKQAATTCASWLSINTKFIEGEQDDYTADSAINTSSLLSFLEQVDRTIGVINKTIPKVDVIIRVDDAKLTSNTTLSPGSWKIAALYDGRSTIKDVISRAKFSEWLILRETSKLLLTGVAKHETVRSLLTPREREDFIQVLKDQLVPLIGPVGVFLVDEAFEKTPSLVNRLAWEEVPSLVAELAENLEGTPKKEFLNWSNTYQHKGTLKN